MKTCTRCLYDEKIENIYFNNSGVCNYCEDIDKLKESYLYSSNKSKSKINKIFAKIKIDGKGKKYDCVIGVSGGIDSSYLLYLAKKNNLKPLAVHYDNTWNSAIASSNLYKVLNKLNIDLYTHVVNNKESDDLFKSFFLSGVSEIEAPTDLALTEVLYRAANKYKIKYVIDGHSFVEEGITPLENNYFDGKYISSIHKRYGKLKIKTYPLMTFFKFIKWTIFSRIKRIRPFWYIQYSKKDAKEFLMKEFDFVDYGGIHHENKMSLFYHTIYLPEKFKKDMRLHSLSAQVRENKISKKEALNILNTKINYNDEIINYFKERLNITDSEYDKVMNSNPHYWYEFKTYKKTFERLRILFKILEKNNLVPTSFYLKYCFPYRKLKK